MKNIVKSLGNNKALSKLSVKARKHSPEICIVGGIIGGVTSTVLACKATLKAKDLLDERKEYLKEAETLIGDDTLSMEFTEEDMAEERKITAIKTGVAIAKEYAPAIVTGTLSIMSILKGHSIVMKRNAALSAAYMAVDSAYKEYRNRVKERFGEEVEQEIFHNYKSEEFVDPETGEVTKKKVGKRVNDPCVRYFEKGNPCHKNDADYNFMFLKGKQSVFNNILIAKGYVFLNDVLEELGFDRVPEGQLIGWYYNPHDDNHENYIDFGHMNMMLEENRDFVTGYIDAVKLTFNVHGNIMKHI